MLGELRNQKKIKIFVENARVIVRTAQVGEDIYQAAKANKIETIAEANNIEIIADDIPDLSALKPRPVETLVRLAPWQRTSWSVT